MCTMQYTCSFDSSCFSIPSSVCDEVLSPQHPLAVWRDLLGYTQEGGIDLHHILVLVLYRRIALYAVAPVTSSQSNITCSCNTLATIMFHTATYISHVIHMHATSHSLLKLINKHCDTGVVPRLEHPVCLPSHHLSAASSRPRQSSQL
jgi:hypothetical protein